MAFPQWMDYTQTINSNKYSPVRPGLSVSATQLYVTWQLEWVSEWVSEISNSDFNGTYAESHTPTNSNLDVTQWCHVTWSRHAAWRGLSAIAELLVHSVHNCSLGSHKEWSPINCHVKLVFMLCLRDTVSERVSVCLCMYAWMYVCL